MEESLSQKLEVEHRMGHLPGIQIARRVKKINHSQFYDDTLLLGVASGIIARGLKKFLNIFLQPRGGGGGINNNKRKIYGWNITGELQTTKYRIFGFSMVGNWSSFKYLGMPIFLKSPSSQAWHEVLGKMIARIQSWGARWLNPIGKLVLLK
jgi:hypothetical protein